LPQRPTPEFFEANLRNIVREFKTKTLAAIAVASLPQVGEDTNSKDEVQAKLNDLYADYCSIIKRVAGEEDVTYIPVHERLHEAILSSPGKAFTAFRFLPFYYDTLRFFVFRKNGDEIARLNGWQYHVDGIHLNSRGGTLVADLLQRFFDTTLKQ